VAGHSATSPWNRYRRSSKWQSFSVQVLPCASVNDVVAAVCAVKSGDATIVPSMPSRICAAYTEPDRPE